jgi:hypothetical protein
MLDKMIEAERRGFRAASMAIPALFLAMIAQVICNRTDGHTQTAFTAMAGCIGAIGGSFSADWLTAWREARRLRRKVERDAT